MEKLIQWEKKITKKSIDSALAYLSLTFPIEKIQAIGKHLKKNAAKVRMYKVSDLIRAGRIAVERGYEKEVSAHLQKIIKGKPLAPVIVVSSNDKLYVGDGYHRICACNAIDDNIEVAVIRVEI